ncbi:MAG: class I SAM-dependent methyltransferase [Candidatus Micrarchaeaceae archaeon]
MAQKKYLHSFYPEAGFGGYTDVDGTIAFYTRVRALMHSSDVVLDVGCGRGRHEGDKVDVRKSLRILKGGAARVIGIDVDQDASVNPFMDEFRKLDGPSWPIEDGSIDLIYSDFVLEHVDDPDNFFSEAWRVLKPGGYICLRTTNKWSYVALVARLIPNRHHAKITELVQEGRQAEDVFPTRYRCNTIPAARRILKRNRFEGVVYGYESEPSYLSFSRIFYGLGVLHQRYAPRLIKPSLFLFARSLPPRK